MPETPRCDMCARPMLSPISSTLKTGAILCGSAHCAYRHSVLPPDHKCAICSKPLPPTRWAVKICEAAACTLELRRRRVPDPTAGSLEQAIGDANGLRARSAAQRGIPGDAVGSYPLTAIPFNSARLSRLPKSRRREFEANLREVLANAHERLPVDDVSGHAQTVAATVHDENVVVAQESVSQLLTTACSMCRGSCCRGGSVHAYLTSDTLIAYMQRHPDHDDETIVSSYVNDIGERTMTWGCVYHGDRGCTLASERRSATCNNFFCGGLRTFRQDRVTGEPVRAYLVQIHSGKIRQSRFVDGGDHHA